MKNSISVIICTHNPDRRRLARVLDAIGCQRNAPFFDLVIVDNACELPIESEILDAAGSIEGRIVREPRPGLSFARACGINNSCSDVLCFVDDDNILYPDYIYNAMAIYVAEPTLGAFAGRARGVFERNPDWLLHHHLARYAIRDLGHFPIHGSGAEWGPWEPFGAGLVVRRDVANAFSRIISLTEDGGPLGRNRKKLASGEDTLISRISHRMGYFVGYRPELTIDHIIPADRMNWMYLFRLVAGQARAQVILNRITGVLEPAPPPRWRDPEILMRRFFARIRNPGLHEALTHLVWDAAYWDQQRQSSDESEDIIREGLSALSMRQ